MSTPATLDAVILAAWIAERRAILNREGCAVRAGAGHTIEVQVINSRTGRFLEMTLPDGRSHFDNDAERDAVLAQLQQPEPVAYVRSGRACLAARA